MSTHEERPEAEARAEIVPAASPAAVAPARRPGNAIRLGPRARRLIRATARMVNPLVLRIAGRRHMPIVGIVRHRGRKTGRSYATPLGVRPAPGGGFVIPLTFSEASQWYQNILAAGWCVITYRGVDHTAARPVVVDRATAGPAYPRYERLALRLIGIDEFLWLGDARDGPHLALRGGISHCPFGERSIPDGQPRSDVSRLLARIDHIFDT